MQPQRQSIFFCYPLVLTQINIFHKIQIFLFPIAVVLTLYNLIAQLNSTLMMSEQQREDKQRYLRENILDRDYDAEQFMDFCESYKGSIDIDSWSLNELKEIVQKFINTNSKTIQRNPFQYKGSRPSSKNDIDWDKDFEVPQKQEIKQPNLNLNLIDLDFLESMGSNSPVQNIQKHQKPFVPPPKVQQKPAKKIDDDPSAILARLNDKSSNQFMSAYNQYAMNAREKQKQGGMTKKPDQKQLEKKVSEREEPSPTNFRKDFPMVPQEQVLIPTSKDTVVVGENFKTSIKCRIFSNKPKLENDYEVTITGHQVINPNLFVPNYVLYTINTSPLGVEVKRRLKDFEALRNLLRKNFPTIQIPYFQRYGGRLSETEPITIKKQKLFLQSFLNSLLMNKQIRCKIIDDFLLCQNLDSFKKIFREFQKLQRPKSLEDMYSNTGRLEIEYNSQNKKYVSQQELYLDYLQTNMIKLKELYDQLTFSVTNSVRIIQQISDLYDNLRDSTKNVNSLLNENLKASQLETTFDKISDLHKHWALSMKTQAKVIEVQARHICRYQAINIETLREICKTTDNLVETYEKRQNKIEAAREQYEFNKRLNQYKTGVQSPSKNTTVLRYQAGHFLSNTVDEIRRYLSEFGEKMTKKFNIFSDLQLNICQELQKNWIQFQTYSKLSPLSQK